MSYTRNLEFQVYCRANTPNERFALVWLFYFLSCYFHLFLFKSCYTFLSIEALFDLKTGEMPECVARLLIMARKTREVE